MKIENKYKTHYIRKNVFVNIVILLSVVLTYILICKFIIYKTKYKQKENAYDLTCKQLQKLKQWFSKPILKERTREFLRTPIIRMSWIFTNPAELQKGFLRTR